MFRRNAISMVAALCVMATARADEKTTADLIDSKRTNDVAQEVGSFAPTQSLKGEVLYSKSGIPVGKIDDIIIDPYTGMAVSLVVIPGPAVGPGYRMLIPFNLVAPIRKLRPIARADVEQIRGGPSIGKGENARPYRRQLARVPFDYYDLDPIWQQTPSASDSKLKDDDLLLYMNTTRDSSVMSGEGKPLGKVDDIAISMDNGRVAYVMLAVPRSSSSNQREPREYDHYPIPLGAFVINPEKKNWVIELPDKLLKETEPVEKDRWPAEISLGWEAYVSERYGEGLLNGAQRELSK